VQVAACRHRLDVDRAVIGAVLELHAALYYPLIAALLLVLIVAVWPRGPVDRVIHGPRRSWSTPCPSTSECGDRKVSRVESLEEWTVDVEGLFTSRAGKVIHSGEVEIAGAVPSARCHDESGWPLSESPSTFFAAQGPTARL